MTRIILSRELSLKEIGQIRERCPDIELEVFVHGALCIAYSGRCLLSGYFNHRDSNQGTCTNSCRWEYRLTDATETTEGTLFPNQATSENIPRHPAADRPYLIEEMGRRQNEWMEIDEDEHGTYIMNSRDLRAIRHVQQLIEMGIDSLKIEGRTKSHYYAARTAQIYRQAIDDAVSGHSFNTNLLTALDGLANRGYTEGFYDRHSNDETQNYTDGASSNYAQQFVASVLDYDATSGLSTLEVRNRFYANDLVEIIRPGSLGGNSTMQLNGLLDKNKQPTDVAPGSGHIVYADLGQTNPLCMLARMMPEQTA